MGCGPVHALDNALRACLRSEFPELERVRLADYRVSVEDAGEGTGAQVRVLIEATDGENSWDAGAVSTNIIDASFEALCSAWVMGIMRGRVGDTSTPEDTLVMVRGWITFEVILPDRDTVIAGDAIVTLDPYTAKTGPRIVAGAAR
jgi:hypothetical protein